MGPLDEVDPLLEVLYGNSTASRPGNSLFIEAERRLRVFQESPESWKLGLELVLSDSSERRQFFGAATLLHKITFQWSTFVASHEELEHIFGCLLSSLAKSVSGPPFVQAKCAQAVAALLVRGFLALSTTDHSPVERIFGTLHSSDLAVLEVIGSLAEQLQRIEVARDDRPALDQCVSRNLPLILSIVSSHLTRTATDPSLLKALEASGQWIQYGIPLESLKSLTERLLPLLFHEDSFETATDVLAVLLADKQVRANQASFFPVFLSLATGPLRVRLLASLEDSDFDTALIICRFFSEIGDAFMEQIVAHLDDPCVRAFPEVMLTCTSAPGYVPVDQELGEASLYFWFNMEETFNELNLPKTPYVADLFKRVLDQMVVSVRRPSASVWQSWSLEVRDRFKAYRSDCFDTVQYCSIIVAHETFGHILPKAWAAMAVNDYDGLESTLYVLTSLADYWMAEWSGLLYQVLTKIVTVVSDVQHSRLVRTTLGLLEAFAGPIIAMGRNSIELSIRFTLSVISNGLCRSNVPIGLRCLNELLRGALSPDFAYSISAAVLNLGHCIAHHDMPRVVEILILVVSNLPQHQRDAELCSMFNLVLRNLQQAQELEHIHSSLVCLKTFLHKLKVSTDCTSQEIPVGLPACLTASCSLLETYCAALSHDESLIGLLCDIFIQIATILNTATLFVSMSQLVQRIFYDRKYIKCFETLGDLGVASISDGAGSMLIFIETALSLMRSPALTEGHPDLVEALCNSLRSAVEIAPTAFLAADPATLSRLFSTVFLWSFQTPEKLALQSLLNLTVTLLRSDPTSAIGHFWGEFMDKFGLTTVCHLIKGIAGGIMPSILPKVAEVLLQFALSYPNPFREWMEKLLIQDDFLCGNVMEAERREFLKTLLGSRQLKRYREAVKTFSIKCRGLEGTAFGGAF